MNTAPPTSPASVALPLMLLPGTVCDTRLFQPMLDAMRDVLGSRQVIIGDMSGCNTMAELADKLLCGAPDRFALLGFSLGGIAALEMVAQQAHRVARLALVNTTARPDPTANAVIRRTAVAHARAHGMDSFILDAWERLVAATNRNNGSLREHIVAMARDGGSQVLAEQTEAAICRADSRPRLAAITVPTLVLAGSEEQVCSIEAHREIAAGIQGAQLHLIENAGHFAPLENPAALAFYVRLWLG